MWEVNVRTTLLGYHVPGETKELRVTALAAAAKVIFDRVIAVWPVDTSRSLAGFRTVQEGNTWFVRNAVDYTPYVHSHPKNGGPVGLADRTTIAAWPEATAAARAELNTVVALSQVVGARGEFKLRRRKPRAPRPPGGGAPPGRLPPNLRAKARTIKAQARATAPKTVRPATRLPPEFLIPPAPSPAPVARVLSMATQAAEARASSRLPTLEAALLKRLRGDRAGVVRELRLAGRAHEAQLVRRLYLGC